MKVFFNISVVALAIALTTVISKAQPSLAAEGTANMSDMKMSAEEKQKEADIQASLAKLSKEDRKLAEAQKFCPIMTKNRLGEMGPPVKVMIKDKPVFLCCKGCGTKAQANPDKTLATVAALLKANAKPEPTKK